MTAPGPVPAASGRRTTTPASARLAVGCVVVSVLLQVGVGRLGPSVAVPPIRPQLEGARLADPWLVTLLLAASLAVGAVGTAAGLVALRAGWRPAPARLLAGAALAVVVLLVGPPLGTADLGGYAAYGRITVLHHDPYATAPRQLAGDPVIDAAEDPWRDTTSFYGPLATAEFSAAAHLGGSSREAVLRLLQGAAGVAFAATALLLDRLAARSGTAARRRVAVLWAANPLLLHQLVAGAHLDALLALAVVVGVALTARTMRRERPARSGWAGAVLGGAVLGLAGLVKVTAAAPAAGLVVGELSRPAGAGRRRAAGIAAAGLVVGVVGYALGGGRAAVDSTRVAGRMVSRATPGRWLASILETVLPTGPARSLTTLVAVVVAVLLARRVFRALAASDPPDLPPTDLPPSGLDLRPLRAALAATLAWLVLAPYALPWYDATGWALLALLALVAGGAVVARLEVLLLVHTAVLSVAYLPGRVVGLPHSIATAQDVVRGVLAPLVVGGVAVGLARLRPHAGPESAPPGHVVAGRAGSG